MEEMMEILSKMINIHPKYNLDEANFRI